MIRRYVKLFQLVVAVSLVFSTAFQAARSQTDGQTSSSLLMTDDQTQKVVMSSQVDNGLRHITFETPNGKLVASLPAEIASTDNIWGSAIAQVAGASPQEKSRNLDALKKLVVQIKPQNGSAVNLSPLGSPPIVHVPQNCQELKVSLYNPEDNSMNSYRIPCLAQPPSPASPVDNVLMPKIAVPKRNFRCGVTGDGSPGSALCTINDKNCPPVAGSPRSQWFQAPAELPLGQAPIKCYLPNSKKVAQSKICMVKPQIYGDKLLHVGDRGQLTIRVKGLSGVKGAKLIFQNLAPETVSVSGGDYQVIPISAP